MKILFTGDINFRGKKNMTLTEAHNIIKDVKRYLDSVDFRVPNLETPLADVSKYAPIKKAGPNLIGDKENFAFLKAMGADAVTLANNHIGDYGKGAVLDTIELLKENNIMYSGAGKNIEKAYEAFYLKKDGIIVSVLSVCENEFGIATETEPGSAGYNPRQILKAIKKEKACSDYVIVVFHGGNEFNPLPSPDTVNRYRFICDIGADAVIAGHTHCPQGYEIYDGKPIVYSMGNFLFASGSERDENDSWYYGYMSVLDIDNNSISLEVIPYKFNKTATQITVFEGEDKEKMYKYIQKLCQIIEDDKMLSDYFMGWAWNHHWCPSLPENFDNSEGYNSSGNYNLVCCEAHHSQLKELLKTLHNEDSKKAEEWAKKIIQLEKMPI